MLPGSKGEEVADRPPRLVPVFPQELVGEAMDVSGVPHRTGVSQIAVETVNDSSPLQTDRRNLDDLVFAGVDPGGFSIKDGDRSFFVVVQELTKGVAILVNRRQESQEPLTRLHAIDRLLYSLVLRARNRHYGGPGLREGQPHLIDARLIGRPPCTGRRVAALHDMQPCIPTGSTVLAAVTSSVAPMAGSICTRLN